MFQKIFKINRKSDEASQALAICTHGVAGAKYFERPLDPASPFRAVLGTKPKVVYFGAMGETSEAQKGSIWPLRAD